MFIMLDWTIVKRIKWLQILKDSGWLLSYNIFSDKKAKMVNIIETGDSFHLKKSLINVHSKSLRDYIRLQILNKSK